nr:hypothetical protein [Lachnospiraceae bacterium]
FKQEGCRRLGIIGHDREYFYNPWNYDLAEHLYQDEPHELLMFLNRHNYESLLSEMTETRILNQTLREERRQFEKELRTQKNEYEKQLRMLQNRFDDMKNSASFKIGRVITAPVRKIRGDRYREPASAHDRQTLEKT